VAPPDFPLLALDAATAAGTVALFIDRSRSEARSVRMGASTEDALLPAIDELCRSSGVRVAAIRSVACGEGPGSFTSLRIAASIAKGIAHANRAALYAIPSLLLAAASVEAAGEYIIQSDAMRSERFAQHVEVRGDGTALARGPVFRASIEQLREYTLSLVAVGQPVDSSSRAVAPDAARAFALSEWQSAGPVDLERWEPSYGRLAEAQVKWEAAHGTPLPSGAS
jgi:tRNA threonylcarbamoyladenosine biosynthesis protein TsaB